MEVDTSVDEHDWTEAPQEPCVACLCEEELNGNGLCATCQPADPEFTRVLLDLLNKPYKLEVKKETHAKN